MLPDDQGPKLHVLVSDTARELCRVAMPLSALDNLEHMFPDEDLKKVKSIGVDFAAAIARVRATDFAPQTVLIATTHERSYKIWIG